MSKQAPAPVPHGRISRLWRLTQATGGIAASTIARGLIGLARGESPNLAAAFPGGTDARRLAERLSRMRGAVMKIGQLMSMDGKDVLPPELVQSLALLRDNAHAMPFGQLVAVLEQELGSGWDRRFRRFDFTPVAAASIGQVHRAETGDGRVLAIKIQYPGTKESIDSDIANLGLLLRLLSPWAPGPRGPI